MLDRQGGQRVFLVRHTREQPGQQIARTACDDGCSHRRHRDAGIQSGHVWRPRFFARACRLQLPGRPAVQHAKQTAAAPGIRSALNGAMAGRKAPALNSPRRSPIATAWRIASPARTVKPRPVRMRPMPPPSPRGRRQESKMCRGGHSGVHPTWAASAPQG